MSKICSFRCLDVEFDVFDTERVPLTKGDYPYFITPSRFAKIEMWRHENGSVQINSKEQLDFLIENDYIGTYKK
jgi:hypothetical protein